MKAKKIFGYLGKLFFRKNYKDFLFKRVFSDKRDILSLYNAINGSKYDNPNDLTVTTLEDAIYMSMKNDLSFIISSTLNLYEHQSTINPNMPIRGLMYFSKIYDAYIKLNNLDIYGKAKVNIPLPQYIVFYNGLDDEPDETILRLSDLFSHDEYNGEPALECVAKVININYGHNKRLLNSCIRLHDYSYFVEAVRVNSSNGMELDDAINQAVDECIDRGILKDILLKHKAEVFNMLLFTYNEKLHKENERKEAREEGLAEGREQGLAEGLAEGREQGLAEGREEGRERGLAEGRAIERVNTEREKARADAAEKRVAELEALLKQR